MFAAASIPLVGGLIGPLVVALGTRGTLVAAATTAANLTVMALPSVCAVRRTE